MLTISLKFLVFLGLYVSLTVLIEDWILCFVLAGVSALLLTGRIRNRDPEARRPLMPEE